LDHLVGAGQERRRYDKPKRLLGPEIDSRFALRRRLHKKVSGLRAEKDSGQGHNNSFTSRCLTMLLKLAV